MNARTQQFEITVEGRQVEEALSCVFHTLLLHRSTGKFTYTGDANYSIGSVGTEDIDCDFIDLTYVRVSCRELAQALRCDIIAFRDALRQADVLPGSSSEIRQGRVTLEFYQRKRRQWPLPEDVVPWEQWHVYVQCVHCQSDNDQRRMRELAADSLADIVYSIATEINKPVYVPKMPMRSDMPLIFDARFADVQPYLFRIEHEIVSKNSYSDQGGPRISHTFKRLLKDTFVM